MDNPDYYRIFLAAYFAIESPEHRGAFIYFSAVMVKTWHDADDSNKEEINESDPLEELEQSLEQSDEEQSKSDNSKL